MCGIFGANFELNERQRRFVRQSLYHRGPDSQNFEILDGWTFFHSRLAIIDLQGGHQPFRKGPICVVFNGEIYNFQDLVRQFALDPKTKSDTEVILLLYEKLGADVFSQLNGMFAIAIYDQRTRLLTLARDRSGKKPLYFSQGRKFAFASEIKALVAAGLPAEVDKSNVLAQLRFGFVPGTGTVYRDISEVGPGSRIAFDEQGTLVTHAAFWQLPKPDRGQRLVAAPAQLAEQFENCLRAAVRRRLSASDLEVGAFLSGGIDSSLVCAYAREISPHLRTFTVASGDSCDESSVASSIAAKLGVQNEVLRLDMTQLAEEYPAILSLYDEPIADESIIPTYYICKAAKERVTVVLTGDGGDEVMGGYRRHIIFRYFRWLQAARFPIEPLARCLSNRAGRMSKASFLQRLSRVLSVPAPHRYWALTTDLFYDAPSPLRAPDFEQAWTGEQFDSLQAGLAADFLGILPKILMKKVDIAAMKHALEPRCPFLDREVIETAWNLPNRYKVRGMTTKWLLRSLVHRRVGPEIAKLPKRGFEVDVKQLLEGTLQELLRDLVFAKSPYYAEILDYRHVESNYLRTSSLDTTRRYKGLFALLNLEIWHRSWLNNCRTASEDP